MSKLGNETKVIYIVIWSEVMVVLNHFMTKRKKSSYYARKSRKNMKKQGKKQIRGYQNNNSYLPPYARPEFQTDIMDMSKFQQEEEERYALIVIDALVGMLTFTQ